MNLSSFLQLQHKYYQLNYKFLHFVLLIEIKTLKSYAVFIYNPLIDLPKGFQLKLDKLIEFYVFYFKYLGHQIDVDDFYFLEGECSRSSNYYDSGCAVFAFLKILYEEDRAPNSVGLLSIKKKEIDDYREKIVKLIESIGDKNTISEYIYYRY